LIGDNGTAQLEVQSIGDFDNYRYSAPETRFPVEDCIEDVSPYTYERDVYGMGMIIYEASFYCPPLVVEVEPRCDLGLDGERAVLWMR